MNMLLSVTLGAAALSLGTSPGPAVWGGGGTVGAGISCKPCIEVILKCTDAQEASGIPFFGRVQNCGNTDLLNIVVTHDNGTPLNPSDDVVVATIPLLSRGAQEGFSGTYQPSVPPGEPSTLVATATGSPPASCGLPDVTASEDATCLSSCSPCLELILKCNDATGGAEIPFFGRVANCGNVDLLNVMVAHDNGTPLDPSDDVLVLVVPLLAPGELEGFSGTYPPSVPAGEPSTLTATAVATPAAICGLKNLTVSQSTTCTQEAAGEGCTPGFWKNHTELWDEASDPIAAAAGFTTDTLFNDFFGLTSAESGFPDSLTMLGAMNLGGGGAFKLARHAVPALLNLAAGLDYDLPDGIADADELVLAIQSAYLTDTFEPLASQLAAANEAGCPF